MRNQLLKQAVGEFREFMLDLELDSRGEESRAFEQSADEGVRTVFQKAAEPLRYARIFDCELARLLVEQLEFPIVEIEKFPVHARFTDD